MCEQQVFEFEDRFRVDRRKLELMVCGKKPGFWLIAPPTVS